VSGNQKRYVARVPGFVLRCTAEIECRMLPDRAPSVGRLDAVGVKGRGC
jgi:hypothetical protein